MEQEAPAELMKIKPPTTITAQKTTIPQQTLSPLSMVTLLPNTYYKHAIIIYRGDGDLEVSVRTSINGGAAIYDRRGNEPGAYTVAYAYVEMTATSGSLTESKRTPTIEILSLSWS
jgi:hypothetical protein